VAVTYQLWLSVDPAHPFTTRLADAAGVAAEDASGVASEEAELDAASLDVLSAEGVEKGGDDAVAVSVG